MQRLRNFTRREIDAAIEALKPPELDWLTIATANVDKIGEAGEAPEC